MVRNYLKELNFLKLGVLFVWREGGRELGGYLKGGS